MNTTNVGHPCEGAVNVQDGAVNVQDGAISVQDGAGPEENKLYDPLTLTR